MQTNILKIFMIVILLSLVSCSAKDVSYCELEYTFVQAKYLEINVSEHKKCIKKKVAEIPNLANPPDKTFIEKINCTSKIFENKRI